MESVTHHAQEGEAVVISRIDVLEAGLFANPRKDLDLEIRLAEDEFVRSSSGAVGALARVLLAHRLPH
jgi:hypothetical protein